MTSRQVHFGTINKKPPPEPPQRMETDSPFISESVVENKTELPLITLRNFHQHQHVGYRFPGYSYDRFALFRLNKCPWYTETSPDQKDQYPVSLPRNTTDQYQDYLLETVQVTRYFNKLHTHTAHKRVTFHRVEYYYPFGHPDLFAEHPYHAKNTLVFDGYRGGKYFLHKDHEAAKRYSEARRNRVSLKSSLLKPKSLWSTYDHTKVGEPVYFARRECQERPGCTDDYTAGDSAAESRLHYKLMEFGSNLNYTKPRDITTFEEDDYSDITFGRVQDSTEDKNYYFSDDESNAQREDDTVSTAIDLPDQDSDASTTSTASTERSTDDSNSEPWACMVENGTYFNDLVQPVNFETAIPERVTSDSNVHTVFPHDAKLSTAFDADCRISTKRNFGTIAGLPAKDEEAEPYKEYNKRAKTERDI